MISSWQYCCYWDCNHLSIHTFKLEKQMKKLLLCSVLLAGLGLAANAQKSPVKIGVKAGVSFPKVTFSGDEGQESAKTNTSFYVGGLVDISVSKTFSVQPGLTLTGKGYKYESSGAFGNISYADAGKTSLMYLEVPVNLVANFEIGPGKIFVGAGPYYGFAISGKSKYSTSTTANGVTSTDTEDVDVKFGSSDESNYKRGDFGLNLLGGYQLKNGFNIHAGYGLGLSNISSTDEDGYKEKNRVFSVGLGFNF